MEISIDHVTCGYEHIDILSDINISFRTGEFWCILGSNGIGKTTLFKTLLGFIPVKRGRILIDGQDMHKIGAKKIAHYISYVPQAKTYSLQYSVLETVLMGRASHIGQFFTPSDQDYEIAMSMLERLGIRNMSQSMYSQLSGGEQQVVLIARALAQEAKFIIMDEPASNLDFENQKRILDVMKTLVDTDVGIVMSSHSPDHAFYCDTNVVLICKDKSILYGSANEIITAGNLKNVYGVDVSILSGTDTSGNDIKACRLLPS